MKLTGRSALITGANQGFGKVIAQTFLNEGAKVAILARTQSTLEATAEELRSQLSDPNQLLWFCADVTDEARMKEVVQESIQAFGKLDILVNNAGVYGPKGALEDTDMAEWRKALDINLMGTLIPMKLVLPHFKANRAGKIINLSGGGATKPMPNFSLYASSKAAVVRLTETIAKEAEGYGIDVNAVAPGALNTRLLQEVLDAGPEVVGDTFYQNSLKQQDKGGNSLEKASNLCTYLGSPESNGVSGRLISAVWDDWPTLQQRLSDYKDTDIYTLRRIVANERGFDDWDL